MILRATILDLQGETRRAVPLTPKPVCWVVRRPERAHEARPGSCRGGFTLLELLLVLALLAMAVAISAPSLARFFNGRALDSEGRRMLALTRYAQSRSVSEGIPMVVWFNPETKSYGIEAETTYTGEDPKAARFELDSSLEMELPSSALTQSAPWTVTTEIGGNHPAIRFTPDGFIDESSPEWVWLKVAREDVPDAVWLTLSENRLNYELQNNQPIISR